MKAKYFPSEHQQAALQAAAEYFACPPEALRCTQTPQAEGVSAPLLVYCLESGETDASLAAFREGGFALSYEEDGLYLELYPSAGGGQPAGRREVLRYLMRKGVTGMEGGKVNALVERGEGRVRIAGKQEQRLLGEDIEVGVSRDEMEATITLLPPEQGGVMLTPDTLADKLKSAGITQGVDMEAIGRALETRKYDTPYTVAYGVPPVDGVNGRLEYHFATEHSGGPRIDDAGKADFKELDLFVPCQEGDLLVTKHPATPGEPGVTVRSRPVKGKEGKEVNLPKGKNVRVNEDKTAMYAPCSGMVELVMGTVVVSNIYKVSRDADMSVGNINFDGSIVVTGNVIAGLSLQATGGISVGGVVEGAELTAGGSIEIKRGIQGNDRCRVTAGGNISVPFIEHATVMADGDLIADAVMHSNVSAGGSILMSGKRCSIMGGSVRAGKELVMRTLGSESHSRTDVEVGVPPRLRQQLKDTAAEAARLEEEITKLEKLGSYLAKAPPDPLDVKKVTLMKSVHEGLILNRKSLEEARVLHTQLAEALESYPPGKVHVSDVVYPGVRIAIGTASLAVNNEIPYATFYVKDNNIAYIPCERSAGKK